MKDDLNLPDFFESLAFTFRAPRDMNLNCRVAQDTDEAGYPALNFSGYRISGMAGERTKRTINKFFKSIH